MIDSTKIPGIGKNMAKRLSQFYTRRTDTMKRGIKLFALLFALLCLLSGCGTMPEPEKPSDTSENPGADSGLTIYFIDVGQADSALVVSGDASMLIDGGNVADSSLIYAFLKEHGITHLDYIIGTHAHEDHIGGLAGALNFAEVGAAYCSVTDFDSKAFRDFIKYLGEQGESVAVPHHGDTFALGGAEVKILGPINPSDDPNDMSIVLKITYGDTSFLFTGDAERAEEADIIDEGYDLSATVLKVGHHGGENSTTYPFLREVMPKYAVISCGANNQYGHPREDTLSRLRDADVMVFRTDMQGTITATSDGAAVTFIVEKNPGAQTNPTLQTAMPESTVEETLYIGNIRTHKLHSPDCGSLPDEKNRAYFDTLSAALAEGYEKHKACLP
jgi:competence protein ComEC